MFLREKINTGKEEKTWTKLKNCNIYDITGEGFKVDINVESDLSGKLYIGTSKYSMLEEFIGVFAVNKYTFEITGLEKRTKYYFYIKNTDVDERARTGVYSLKTVEYIPIFIDIGSPATARLSNTTSGYTYINLDNPANATGKIDVVEIYCIVALQNCKVATFFVVSGDNLSTRDIHTIGAVPAGSKQTFSGLDIDVQAGDYIGIFYTAGNIRKDNEGFLGVMEKFGDQIPCINQLFYLNAGNTLSLYGTGIG